VPFFGLKWLTISTFSNIPSNSTAIRTPKVTTYNEVPQRSALREVVKVTTHNEVPQHTSYNDLPASMPQMMPPPFGLVWQHTRPASRGQPPSSLRGAEL
jgi:hypothetical protein